jgi:hypothetical protein
MGTIGVQGMGRAARSGIVVLGLMAAASADGQPARGRRATQITIPFLASTTRPDDLEFEGAECDVHPSGTSMTCRFQQLFVTTSDVVPQTCLVTTNRYARIFKKQSATRWISRAAATGPCGLVEITTLQDDGGVRWTMEMRKQVTRKDAAPACRELEELADTRSWQNIRRPLPCAFIQPGGISR